MCFLKLYSRVTTVEGPTDFAQLVENFEGGVGVHTYYTGVDAPMMAMSDIVNELKARGFPAKVQYTHASDIDEVARSAKPTGL